MPAKRKGGGVAKPSANKSLGQRAQKAASSYKEKAPVSRKLKKMPPKPKPSAAGRAKTR